MELTTLKPTPKPRIGLYVTGLKAYWAQFPGLRERLVEYGQFIASQIAESADVHFFGLVDCAASAREAGESFNRANVGLVFCHSATYITSDRLSRCDQLEDARQIIARFCLELMSISQEKARRATDAKHERLHDELVNYLRENLSDPNLSLESTAERFNLSPGYLGKLVKASSGDTFSSLLSTMRLEKAAQLLIDTSQPAYKVAEQVGIPNVAYFSTLFKRQYGLSPAPFREKRGNLG